MRKWTLGLSLALALAAGCNRQPEQRQGAAPAAGARAPGIKIAMIAKSSTNPVFLSARTGAEAAAKATPSPAAAKPVVERVQGALLLRRRVRGRGLVAVTRLRSRYRVGRGHSGGHRADKNSGRAKFDEARTQRIANQAHVHDCGKSRVAKVHAPFPARRLLSKFHPPESMVVAAARCGANQA